MFLRILIFDPNWSSSCVVTNFGDFRKPVILRILGVFWSGFLHRTTLMCFWSRFWPFFLVLLGVFWSRILHRTTLMTTLQTWGNYLGHTSRIKCDTIYFRFSSRRRIILAYQLLCHIYKKLYRQDYREYIIGLSYKIWLQSG